MTPKLALLLPCEEQSSSEEVDVGPFESSSSSVVSSPSPSPSLSPRAVGYGALDNRRPDLEEECSNSNNSSSCDEEELHGEEQDQVRVPPLVVRDYRVTNNNNNSNSNNDYDYETGDFPELAARRSASYSGTTSLMVNIEEWRQLFYFGIIVLTMVIIIFGVVLVGGDSFVATTGGGGGGGMSNDRSGGLGLATADAAAATN